MSDEPKVPIVRRIANSAIKVWKFLDGHKTKIGTGVYLASRLLGDTLPPKFSTILNTSAEIMMTLGWVHYVYKGKDNVKKIKSKVKQLKTN